ncbi:TetR family transcriptional regulator [Nocardia sp. ET3-3]|uniref:TetR family transcriptional regulator n=1 Tax=Nocardia terrae TaxID=2675851 RepID=A0A7K1UQD9_9NOCA|nr:TetR/AcrR family transcriptional regulator [Nocardia terrae]MVU76563.1 TetR family transcriptional regulator [Nocardia terrae]
MSAPTLPHEQPAALHEKSTAPGGKATASGAKGASPRATAPTSVELVARPNQASAAPSVRADARRNRALVLAAAHRALAERGAAVSLTEVARRAGVGAGTVYRHFPTKTALLEAVMEQRINRLTGLAHRLRDAPDPGAAFFSFCTEVITSTHRNQALCDLVSNDGWPRELVRDAGTRFHTALEDLLTAAQRQGVVRSDLTLADVLALFTGCVAIQRLTSEHELSRPAALVLDSMRAHPSTIPVTKPRTTPRSRDESTRRHETPHCPICTTPIHPAPTGRPARYCSPACRQKAHRRRHTPESA